ncbi:MAG: FAD/NAD(P)-binding oxidoreductase [Campylobacterota bacterium]|nr:FAD/NAD(P)-binding oxidoreductase [Campylobacterota bacterium]
MIENRNMKKDLEQLDAILKEQGISRRDAMKMMGLGGAAFMMGGATQAEAATIAQASDAKGKILIVGGGLAGMSTAARFTNELSNPDITVIEPEADSVSYQPGQTLVGAGLWEKSEIVYKRDDFVPSGVKIVKEKAITFDPDNNTVTTDKGTTIKYDYLVLATGVKLNYGAIKGLESIGELYSSGDNKGAVKAMTDMGISSIFSADGSAATWSNMQKFIADAKSGKKVKGVFTHPNTPIKCGGAPKKIMYLTNARLKEAGADARANADLHFYPNGSSMFGVKEYHEAIKSQFEREGLKWSYAHNLIAVDGKNKIATFNHHWKEKGEWDEDLEEFGIELKSEEVKVSYDFLHITPPMKAPDEIANSKLGSSKGWVPVTKETLQHVKYPNVFSLGDVVAVPMGKTGGSARKQYKVVVNNIISMMKGNAAAVKTNPEYEGYTVCPLTTTIGTVMLAEFNWTKKPTPMVPLDPTQERYIWWLLKIYLLKPMTVYGMLSGKA